MGVDTPTCTHPIHRGWWVGQSAALVGPLTIWLMVYQAPPYYWLTTVLCVTDSIEGLSLSTVVSMALLLKDPFTELRRVFCLGAFHLWNTCAHSNTAMSHGSVTHNYVIRLKVSRKRVGGWVGVVPVCRVGV